MHPISFRAAKITYYGPQPCTNCGVNVVKMAERWGGTAFTYPAGPIYPNTEWPPHVCDQVFVRKMEHEKAINEVRSQWKEANSLRVEPHGFVILMNEDHGGVVATVLSPNGAFYDDEGDAWVAAKYRARKELPMWQIDLIKYGASPATGNATGKMNASAAQ